jgi:shikimate dehydrogenase
MENKNFKAINVTIPYKEMVIPYLSYIDPKAKEIGAVNTVVNIENNLYINNFNIFLVVIYLYL